jgi:hypothetical protein
MTQFASDEADLIAAHERVQSHYVAYLKEKLRHLPSVRIGETFPKDREEWVALTEHLRPALRDVYDFPKGDAPLHARTVGHVERDDFTIEKIIYETEPNSSVPAHLFIPKGVKFPVPALIFPSGHGGSKSAIYNHYAGQLYARAGLICLIPDPVGEEERDEKGRAGVRGHRLDFRVDRCYEVGRSVIGKMTYDIVRGLDYLCERPEVDTKRLGCVGHSLGCTLVMNVLSTDSRLALSLPASWVTHFDYIVGGLSCEWRPYRLKHFADMPEQIAMGAPGCATLVQGGEWDYAPRAYEGLLETCRQVRRVYQVCGVPERFDVQITSKGGHRPYFLNKPAFAWVEKHLGMPRFDAEAVAALPEIYLGDWADAHGIEIERGYRSHKHYAGTVAVDLDVNPVPEVELACLEPGGFSAPQFAMQGWVASLMSQWPPPLDVPDDLETWQIMKAALQQKVASVIAVPEDRPRIIPETVDRFEWAGFACEQVQFGALGLSAFWVLPKVEATGAVMRLDASRTKEGALQSDEVKRLLGSGKGVLALDCVGLDDSGLLLGQPSTTTNVLHVMEALDFLESQGFEKAWCAGYVDDVALYMAVLDNRISGVTVGSIGGTIPHVRQGYRQEGVVPYISKVIGRPGLLALVAPRPMHLLTTESDLACVHKAYGLYGVSDHLTLNEKCT